MTGVEPTQSSIGLQPQARDFALLRGLFESRVMTLQHATVLYFDGRAEAAKKRIQKLKAGGFIAELPRRPAEPSILRLTNEGIRMLADEGALSLYPPLTEKQIAKRMQVSPLTLRHELDVLSIKTAFIAAVRGTPGLSVAEFNTWPLLNSITVPSRNRLLSSTTETVVKPDGFIRLHEEHTTGAIFEHMFYLELDRSTERLDILAQKARQYLAYYRSGVLAERLGQSKTEYREFPFRVIMVLRTDERRDNTAGRLLVNNPPTLTQVWLTTFNEITQQPLASIWLRPKDYRGSAHTHDLDASRVPGWRLNDRNSTPPFTKRCLLSE